MSIRINRVYTRSGDAGETGLVGGTRVKKSHGKVELYGELDELNSVLGVVKEHISESCRELFPVVEQLQQELFDLGSELATAHDFSYEGMWHCEERHVTQLEKLCDKFGDGLPELRSFILPGGSMLASQLHIARTVCRRVERSAVAFNEEYADEAISEYALQYLNRLSDLLFIFARWSLEAEGREAPLWIKEADRISSTK